MSVVSKKFTVRDAKRFIITPSELDHKYSRGVLGVITGSAQYPGAAVLTTAAASATGVGMVRFYSSSGLAHLVLHTTPEVVVQPGKVNAWLLGSGIESAKYKHFSTWLRHRWFVLAKRQSVPTILDAGALHLAGTLRQPTLITPHYAELAGLLNSRGMSASTEAIEGDPKKWICIAVEKLGVTILLKGSRTLVANKNVLYELPRSSPWLATAGSGDVLAGIIGSIVATNAIETLNDANRLAEIAATGALIHLLAADKASNNGPISAQQIITKISEVIQKIIN